MTETKDNMKGVIVTNKNTKKLTACALLTALSAILALMSKLIPAPWPGGGSITIASAVPVITASLLYGWKWGIMSSLTYAGIQMITGFYPPPTREFADFVLVIFLDYILAFGIFGAATFFYNKRKKYTIPLAGFSVMCIRYICHILSGVLIWGIYAKEGQSVFVYSLLYNGSYMIPEIIITSVALAGMINLIERLKRLN